MQNIVDAMTEEELADATHTIACLMLEYYDKDTIISMYPRYAEIYDEVQGKALALAMSIISGNRQ